MAARRDSLVGVGLPRLFTGCPAVNRSALEVDEARERVRAAAR